MFCDIVADVARRLLVVEALMPLRSASNSSLNRPFLTKIELSELWVT
jgi:hypothetical protein